MENFTDSLLKAFKLLLTFDKEIYLVAFVSVRTAFFSTFFAGLVSIPFAYGINSASPRLKKGITILLNSFMAVPTVVVGLFIYGIISRTGPLGFAGLLFTPAGIVIGQTILAMPIISSIILSGFSKIDSRLHETLVTLGAKKFRLLFAVIKETKFIIISAVLGGFGRVIGEVGISMMLGGNIRWYTRTLTTAIALETSKGEFSYALSLGIILIIIALGINSIGHLLISDSK